MPSIPHEAPLDLLRRQPLLAAVLLRGLGVPVPAGVTATLVSADLGAPAPVERRADQVVLLSGPGGAKAVVVVEVQLRYDKEKVFRWPTYVVHARDMHRCDAFLLVICTRRSTGRRCRALIKIGHPGFGFSPLVCDAATVPWPGDDPASALVRAELMVLAVLTGAADLGQESTLDEVVAVLLGLDEDRFRTYTGFVLNAASPAERRALEARMATTHPFYENAFVDAFIDRIKAEVLEKGLEEGEALGLARGKADAILRVLAARGVTVPEDLRQQVLSCTDTAQLDAWSDKAATATKIEDVFESE